MSHLFSCMFLSVLVLPYYQYTFGGARVGIGMVCTGIVGNMFSNLLAVDETKDMLKAGSNVMLFGVTGIGIGYVIVNWSSLNILAAIFKLKIVVNFLFSIMFLLIFANAATNPDILAFFGTLLAGIFFAGMMPSIETNSTQIIIRTILTLLFWVMALSCFLFFYLLPQSSYSY